MLLWKRGSESGCVVTPSCWHGKCLFVLGLGWPWIDIQTSERAACFLSCPNVVECRSRLGCQVIAKPELDGGWMCEPWLSWLSRMPQVWQHTVGCFPPDLGVLLSPPPRSPPLLPMVRNGPGTACPSLQLVIVEHPPPRPPPTVHHSKKLERASQVTGGNNTNT